MKVLLLNHSDQGGGAAIATMRLYQSLLKQGVDAALWVVKKNIFTDNSATLKTGYLSKGRISKAVARLKRKLQNRAFSTTNPILHSQNFHSIIDVDEINNSDFDIVHLHWINFDMISIEDIAKIKKPILWTLHDTWAFCGAEHYPNVWENDDRYKVGYYLNTKPGSTKGFDVCRRTWNRKMRCWAKLRIMFICPSVWMCKELRESKLYRNNRSVVIPNVIPEKIFYNFKSNDFRKILNIPAAKRIIGFGAAYDIKNERSIKGGDQLIKALNSLINPEMYFLIIFGPTSVSFFASNTTPAFYTGYIEKAEILALIYNCCDVFVVPSVIESFGMTALEAQKCGVPVVAFDTSGIKDIIRHKETGYLAPLFDTDELAKGIEYCIANRDELSKNALTKAHNDFSEELIVEKHIKLYQSVLNEIEK